MSRKLWTYWILAVLCVSATAQSHPYKKLDSVRYSWGGQALEFVIEQQTGFIDGEPDQAPARLRLLKDGQPMAAFSLKWGVAKYAGELANLATFPKNLVKSQYLLFANIAGDKPPLLLVVGPAIGDTHGPVYAFTLDASGKPQHILNSERFGFTRFDDADGDGVLEIIATSCLPSDGPDEPGSYDPFLVWKVGEDAVRLDGALTQRYNEKHYVWSGADCRDDVKAVKDKSGKYKLVPVADYFAEREKNEKK